MKHGPLLCFGLYLAGVMGVCVSAPPAAAQTNPKPPSGTLSGEVSDATGIPQLGATVQVLPETAGISAARLFLTNTQGLFRGEKLKPGFYSVKVTLAGFLPSLETHIRVSSNLTTVVRVQLESMFASIEQLRRPPTTGMAEPDDWTWVLRSAPGLRPVLQWHEDDAPKTSAVVMDTMTTRPLARIELMDGARRPGSVSNMGAAPSTAFAYDQRIDQSNHLVFAGQATQDPDLPAGGLAVVWLPTGLLENSPQSTIVVRDAKISPNGPEFRGVRLAQGATFTFGDRFVLRAGGEYVLVGVGASASSLRPRMKLETKLAPNWYLDIVYAAMPNDATASDALASEISSNNATGVLTRALDQLDAFPALLWRRGGPVLESGQHEEVGLEHRFSPNSVLQMAGFHDDNGHVAVFGHGNDLPAAEYVQDLFSKGFAYDGGSSSSWGARAALRERISDDLELTAIYTFSGALVPVGALDGTLRDILRTEQRHSLGGSITAKVPKAGTHVTAGYKWINGTTASRVDPYGEGLYQVDPFLHVGIRQPLPKFVLGRWEASAECDNLLAQGYTSVSTRDGQVLLIPAFRSFRGGLSVQF